MKINIWCQNYSLPLSIAPPAHTLYNSLAQALWLSGKLSPLPLCSGLGRCGLCRIRFISQAPSFTETEENILGTEAINNGWRLSCKHTLKNIFNAQESIDIEVPYSTFKKSHNNDSHTQKHSFVSNSDQEERIFLAVDLGTTSFCWQTLSAQGKILQSGKYLNPLMGAGADIISRLRYAMQPQGAKELAHILQENLQELLNNLPPVKEICLAANTAMSALFLQKDITSLAHAPYSLPYAGHNTEHINGLPPIYFPPQAAPFVGGDITAGYAALLQRDDLTFPFIFADLGTNGEFILALNSSEAFITSVPMGPSLEGIGLRFGHMVDTSPGIVSAVSIGTKGLVPHTLDSTKAQKICGTGYISLIHALLKVGIIAKDGTFMKNPLKISPLHKKIAQNFQSFQNENVLYLWKDHSLNPMYISAMDVEEILKVKAAFTLAVDILLKSAHLRPADLKHFYLAGAMGSHLHIPDLEALGFVPYGAAKRIKSVGNSALEGAALLLTNNDVREKLQQFSESCTLINLTEHQNFTEKFLTHMHFSYEG